MEEISEPPPWKRASKLTEKVTCEGCGTSLSLHAYKYSRRCKARAPDEPLQEEKVNTRKLKEALKEVKPSLTEKQSTKPVTNKVLIQRTPEYIPPEPPYQPS